VRKINIEPKWLKEQYITNIRDANDMAKEIGCSGNTIRLKLEEIGINRRPQCIYKKGHEVTEETKRKISEHHNQKSNSYWSEKRKQNFKNTIKEKMKLGYIPTISGWWKNKKHTKEHNNKISQSLMSSLLCRGENAPNWRGGISNEPYPFNFNKELKKLIRQRDNYKCQLCGMPECENIQKLDIHHIDYDKKNLNPNNLISLCRSCHMKTNYNREYWKRYFDTKIKKKEVI